MNTLTRTGLVALIFIAGCATGGVASQFVVPPARAQDTQKWDYMCFGANVDGITGKAKQAGAEGWELVTGAGLQQSGIWCFRRPL
jgi:hypothetical protein